MEVMKLIKKDLLFRPRFNLENNNKYYISLTFERLKKIIDLKLINVYELETNPHIFLEVMNILHMYDLSLAVKTGVNFGLFGGSILRLGSQEQRKLLNYVNNGQLLGCLAITEIGHGSNLKGLETEAIWDNDTKSFIINSPTNSSHKYWIGNAIHGNFAVVFAQLYINNECYGIHPFLVPLRIYESFPKELENYMYKNNIEYKKLYKGVNVKLLGKKAGLNGVDNGEIFFDNVKIPRNNLLSKFGYVDNNGQYISSHKKPEKRFGELLSTLSGGRGTLAMGANKVTLKAVNMMYEYSKNRRQFSNDKEKEERSIISYPTVFNKIKEPFIKCICLDYALEKMLEIGIRDFKETNKISKTMHALSSGLKVYSSELAYRACDNARLIFAGHGYLYENQICKMRDDIDIWRTFEGDNNLLRQEVVKCSLELLSRSSATFSQFISLSYENNNTVSLSYKDNNTIEHLKNDPVYAILSPLNFKSVNDIIYTRQNDKDKISYYLDKVITLLNFKYLYQLSDLFKKVMVLTQEYDGDSFKAWNENLVLVNEIADLKINLMIIEYCEDIAIKDILIQFCIDTFSNNVGWLLMHNKISIEEAKEICDIDYISIEKFIEYMKFNKIDKQLYNIPIFGILNSKL